ncbi:MAG: ATP-binding protein [Erysipelotrichaceae bacterium]|nr:ATP-binding protein [Erysipelotrichaceae bacterium]
MKDFIEGAALFSDIYACSGMKIVLSGTDSLGFIFTASDQLYDRCSMLHTTFIPYREFEHVLGIKGIDEYIRYGGTMSMGGVYYNEKSSFATKESTDEYINTAIASNIQHSLKYYQDGGHFRHLYELYREDELTSAINRVIEDINHRFTKEVLTQTFKSNTLSVTARNLLKDRDKQFDLMDNINQDFVVATIKKMLTILEMDEQKVVVSDIHASEIREYLLLLDLIVEIDQMHLPNVNNQEKKIAISQSGLRYAQVEALVDAMLLDEKFNELSIVERNWVIDRIMSTVQGRMMEDIVLLETKLAKKDKKVFQLQFAVGEFDMVVHNPKEMTCEIYEIKHSKEVVPAQYHHLVNEEKCVACEHRYGTITGRYVIYRGEDTQSEGVQYLNVEDYLKNI